MRCDVETCTIQFSYYPLALIYFAPTFDPILLFAVPTFAAAVLAVSLL